MSDYKVIHPENRPVRLPICGTIVWWLLFDRIAAPGWAWGASACFMACWWVAVIIATFHCGHLERMK